jgi:hypothetical protein
MRISTSTEYDEFERELKKTIPAMVVSGKIFYYEDSIYQEFMCPCCGAKVAISDIGRMKIFIPSHCNDCLQKLKGGLRI